MNNNDKEDTIIEVVDSLETWGANINRADNIRMKICPSDRLEQANTPNRKYYEPIDYKDIEF